MRDIKITIAKTAHLWYGFSVPQGAAFGTLYLNGIMYDYVYTGIARDCRDKYGRTTGFKEIKVFMHEHVYRHDPDYKSEKNPIWVSHWCVCTCDSKWKKLWNKNVHFSKDKQRRADINNWHVENLQDFSSAIKRPSSAGAIFNMVRERQ